LHAYIHYPPSQPAPIGIQPARSSRRSGPEARRAADQAAGPTGVVAGSDAGARPARGDRDRETALRRGRPGCRLARRPAPRRTPGRSSAARQSETLITEHPAMAVGGFDLLFARKSPLPDKWPFCPEIASTRLFWITVPQQLDVRTRTPCHNNGQTTQSDSAGKISHKARFAQLKAILP
jgi:hypothetical protein